MIKNILFFAATFVSAGLVAQTFDLMDSNDNSIVGSEYLEFDNPTPLQLTKFHVKNVSGATAGYTADVQELVNSTGAELQVCYGTACYTATAGVSTVQEIGDTSIVISLATDENFKVAPFTSSWIAGDSAVWKVIVRNVADPSDTVTSIITWKADETTSLKELSTDDIVLSIHPNPATDYLVVNYTFRNDLDNVKLNFYNVLGKKVMTKNLKGDSGNIKLNVEAMNAGVYFYSVEGSGSVIRTERFIVK